MSLSSVCVVSNALRLRVWKPSLTVPAAVPTEAPVIKTESDMTPEIIKEETTMEKTMVIKGMMCPHCSGRVEKTLNDLPGVTATVDLAAGTATVKGDVTDEVLTQAITAAGYEVVEIK